MKNIRVGKFYIRKTKGITICQVKKILQKNGKIIGFCNIRLSKKQSIFQENNKEVTSGEKTGFPIEMYIFSS